MDPSWIQTGAPPEPNYLSIPAPTPSFPWLPASTKNADCAADSFSPRVLHCQLPGRGVYVVDIPGIVDQCINIRFHTFLLRSWAEVLVPDESRGG